MSTGENYERKITPIRSNISRFSRGTVQISRLLGVLSEQTARNQESSKRNKSSNVGCSHVSLPMSHSYPLVPDQSAIAAQEVDGCTCAPLAQSTSLLVVKPISVALMSLLNGDNGHRLRRQLQSQLGVLEFRCNGLRHDGIGCVKGVYAVNLGRG